MIEKYWEGGEAIDAFNSDFNGTDLHPDERAERIINEAAPMAAMEIVYLAKHATAEGPKLLAAKFIVERALDIRTKKLEAEQDELGKLLAGIQTEPAG